MSYLPSRLVLSIRDSDQELRYLSFTGPDRRLRFDPEVGIHDDNVVFIFDRTPNGLVHIRSRFDNNYWVRASRNEPWLVASPREKEEDMSKDECTLFRTIFKKFNMSVNFVHAQSGLSVVMRPSTDAHAYNLCVESGPPTDFTFIGQEDLRSSKLPRYAMFRGSNNRYLTARSTPQYTGLYFESENTTDRSVGFEIEYTRTGNIRVKSMRFDGLWSGVQFDGKWPILVLPKPNPNDLNTFKVLRVSGTPSFNIFLRCLSTNMLCVYADRTGVFELAENPVPIGYLRFIEPMYAVGTRKVNIESFRHQLGSRGYVVRRNVTLSNPTNVEREHLFIDPNVHMSIQTTFENSIRTQINRFRAEFNGRIPFITTSGELEFPDEITTVLSNWNLINSSSVRMKIEETLILPPNTQVDVRIEMKTIAYEIPFSYHQDDVLPFGGSVTQYLHDAVLRIYREVDAQLKTFHTPIDPILQSAKDTSSLGVELVPGSGIFVQELECPRKQDEVDEEYDAETDIGPDGLDQVCHR
ncbi:hypothetical protein RND81_14G219700 [Saponaria officinalis]|uniref:Agglutinin domain-containing protein n=1 Tax=Saponaria officinalis TaxID=3572 RepID=A0AAW1GPW6_SAPOF